MTPTPTEEDRRLAREWITTVENTQGVIPNAGRLVTKLAVFRAEARREDDTHVEYLQRQIRLLESGDAATAQKAQQEVEERLQQARLETSRIRQSEREACERIVEAVRDDPASSMSRQWYEACDTALRLIRKRALHIGSSTKREHFNGLLLERIVCSCPDPMAVVEGDMTDETYNVLRAACPKCLRERAK